ncbi:hypothetical protein ABES03_10005 [Neobacillus rhizosphaerae]
MSKEKSGYGRKERFITPVEQGKEWVRSKREVHNARGARKRVGMVDKADS